MFFKNPKRHYSIQKLKPYNKTDYLQSLTEQLNQIDRQIEITNKAILDAQVVKFRYLFSTNNNFFLGLQKKMIESNVNKSLQWHLLDLKDLRGKRRKVQTSIDILTGNVWSRRIRNLSKFLLLISILLTSTAIFIITIFASISLIPLLVIAMLIIVFFKLLEKVN